jgi:Domain of unknown function (DUF4411)
VPYSIDTSAFLDAWVRHYPPDVFPRMWEQMDRAARNGTLFASDEVLRELDKKDDGAHDWMDARPEMIVKLDSEIEQHVQEIMARYPRLVDSKKGRSGGDPFVIAVARARNLTVITSENATGRIDVPRIPDVCEELQIRWLRILGFFREQKWAI